MILLDIKKKYGKQAGRFAKEGSLVAYGFTKAYKSIDNSGRKVDCRSLKDMLVIHCSHASTDISYREGLFPIEGLETMKDSLERRSEAAAIFLEDFRSQCMPK